MPQLAERTHAYVQKSKTNPDSSPSLSRWNGKRLSFEPVENYYQCRQGQCRQLTTQEKVAYYVPSLNPSED